MTPSSLSLSINDIKNKLLASIGLIYIVFGTIGNLFNILLFTRRSLRSISPCIPFLLAASIADLSNILTYVVLRMLIGFNITPVYYSSFLCKLQIFIYNTAICLANWYVVGCCIDRFFSSSRNTLMRQKSNMQNTHRAALIIATISIAIFAQIFYCYDANQPGGLPCNAINSTCSIIAVVLTFIFQTFGPPIMMLVFGIGTYVHVRSNRRQGPLSIGSTVGGLDVTAKRNRKNRAILSILTVQVTIFLVGSIPLLAYRVYSSIPVETVKTDVRISAEGLFLNMAVWLNLMDKIFSFYIYTLASSHFRREFIRLFTRNRQQRRVAPRN